MGAGKIVDLVGMGFTVAGFLRRTERERCIVARVEIAWIEFWIGFTVEDTQNFWNTLEACGWVSKGLFKRSI